MDVPAVDTRARILDAAAALLRRHGPDKRGVVYATRRRGMTDGTVDRHGPGKPAPRAAVGAAAS